MDSENEPAKKCPCGLVCMQQAVVSIQVTGGGQALDYSRGFVVKILCSQTDVVAARLSVLTEKCELSNYPFQVLLSNSAASGNAQKNAALVTQFRCRYTIFWVRMASHFPLPM